VNTTTYALMCQYIRSYTCVYLHIRMSIYIYILSIDIYVYTHCAFRCLFGTCIYIWGRRTLSSLVEFHRENICSITGSTSWVSLVADRVSVVRRDRERDSERERDCEGERVGGRYVTA
jgi:hypothetical protein